MHCAAAGSLSLVYRLQRAVLRLAVCRVSRSARSRLPQHPPVKPSQFRCFSLPSLALSFFPPALPTLEVLLPAAAAATKPSASRAAAEAIRPARREQSYNYKDVHAGVRRPETNRRNADTQGNMKVKKNRKRKTNGLKLINPEFTEFPTWNSVMGFGDS